MPQKILDFIMGEDAAQRRHDEWARDYYRAASGSADKPRAVTMDEVYRRVRWVVEDARRRGELPPEPGSRWAKFLT